MTADTQATEVNPSTSALIRRWDTFVNPSHVIRADYSGGAYIELTFGSEEFQPTEVLNVWSYEHGKPEGPFHRWDDMTQEERMLALEFEVQAWIRGLHEEGWSDWYQGYMDNR